MVSSIYAVLDLMKALSPPKKKVSNQLPSDMVSYVRGMGVLSSPVCWSK